ncbi:MAG: 2-amino-4-hydroxy-6-hydroxymethyldihydropteridine diphosphokinase [Desulfobacter sp.]|nr:2-amino-4-hydroxy-6-hydroxymethyldihydropteridine diphosphokinase [Desulfobacter sp.]WDP86579.1 MAG: 2-amino-4-hydroxy-6-hydroxymethyldihydropteridine diphosphokinase [Desulfobacter sp.]
MQTWNTAYLSIGSNRGNKLKNLSLAIQCLEKDKGFKVDQVSNFYKTAPQNYTDQDWFINAAVKIATLYTPKILLDQLKLIEKKLDKEGKPFRFGPRIIDLDIIYYSNLVIKTKDLELPHPRMHERCFVLKPLCDIGKTQIHPILGLGPDELLKQIQTDQAQAVIPLDQEEIREIFY